VRREKRRGKMVTVVAGLDAKAADLPGLLKELRAKFGTGGTIAEGELELQGDHRDKVVALLVERGFKAKAAGG
jgi:translation initiation factor 1